MSPLKGMQGRRDGSTSDEHFAWQSKEFLRKLTIGQVCFDSKNCLVIAL
jgi:hypothetical protein